MLRPVHGAPDRLTLRHTGPPPVLDLKDLGPSAHRQRGQDCPVYTPAIGPHRTFAHAATKRSQASGHLDAFHQASGGTPWCRGARHGPASRRRPGGSRSHRPRDAGALKGEALDVAVPSTGGPYAIEALILRRLPRTSPCFTSGLKPQGRRNSERVRVQVVDKPTSSLSSSASQCEHSGLGFVRPYLFTAGRAVGCVGNRYHYTISI